jgi:hypothetical protein
MMDGSAERALGTGARHEIEFDGIPRIACPDVEEFRRSFEKPARPVVLTGIADRWPAMGRWSLEYFERRFGPSEVVALRVKDGRVDVGGRQPGTFVKVRLGAFIASLRSGQPLIRYVSTPLDQMPRELREDYRVPLYCDRAPWSRPKLWLGSAGTVMPLHFDVSLNLYALVTGKKRFVLYPPAQSRLLYPCGFFSKAPNFAEVDPEVPDRARFPRFANARPLGCVLSGGEVLYLPRGWWHHVRSIEDSIAIGFWYGGYGTAALSTASIAYRRLRGLSAGEWGRASADY